MNPGSKAPLLCPYFLAKLVNIVVHRTLGCSVFAPQKPFQWVLLDALSLLSQLHPGVFLPHAVEVTKPSMLFCFGLYRTEGMRDLSSPMELVAPAVEAWSLKHWTAREVPQSTSYLTA